MEQYTNSTSNRVELLFIDTYEDKKYKTEVIKKNNFLGGKTKL